LAGFFDNDIATIIANVNETSKKVFFSQNLFPKVRALLNLITMTFDESKWACFCRQVDIQRDLAVHLWHQY
jgi:hypothetical protein